ncbi:Uncharacterised protein [Mycobacterium tuberculosis]|nr:Uncharacterised protein [Mycobacterium tuberculosis]CMS41833.1 Uncharacterised protein [Mycobacterium tuberculosis]
MAAGSDPSTSTLAEGATPTGSSCGFGVEPGQDFPALSCWPANERNRCECAPVSKSGTNGSVPGADR